MNNHKKLPSLIHFFSIQLRSSLKKWRPKSQLLNPSPLSTTTATTEIVSAKCECCALIEECTPAYIAKIRDRFHGHWICGLCSETVKDEDSESAACCSDFRHEKRETTPLSIRSDESYDLESTAERQPRLRSAALITPPDAEIEEFFATAERKETQRFAEMYNFDVVKYLPFEGRYDWIRIAP